MYIVVITGRATLRVLDVSCNDIGDEGMSVIAKTCPHKTLTELGIGNCGLSVKSMLFTIAIAYNM